MRPGYAIANHSKPAPLATRVPAHARARAADHGGHGEPDVDGPRRRHHGRARGRGAAGGRVPGQRRCAFAARVRHGTADVHRRAGLPGVRRVFILI